MTKKPSWQYDEFRHFGVDFSSQEEVRTYDSKQGTTIEMESQLVTDLGIHPEHALLEFGCGTGCFAIAAARHCRSVLAVDVSKAMLEYTSNRAAALGLKNLETCHAGFLSYQHTGGPVDWIVTKYTLHHLPDAWKSVALVKMHDCMAPSGTMFLRDVVFSFAPPEYATHYQDWVDAMTGTFTREEFEAHIRDEYSTHGFLMESLLEAAGFVIAEANYPSPMYADYKCNIPSKPSL